MIRVESRSLPIERVVDKGKAPWILPSAEDLAVNLSTFGASRQTVESSSMEVQPPAVTHTTGLPKGGEDGVLGDVQTKASHFSAE